MFELFQKEDTVALLNGRNSKGLVERLSRSPIDGKWSDRDTVRQRVFLAYFFHVNTDTLTLVLTPTAIISFSYSSSKTS
jgi:hypothetical protein